MFYMTLPKEPWPWCSDKSSGLRSRRTWVWLQFLQMCLSFRAEGGGNFRQKLKLFWLAAKAKNVYRWCFFHEGTMFENKWFRTGTDWSLDVSNFFRRQKFEFERFVKSAKSIKGRSRLPLFGDRTILFLIPSVTSSDQISMSC